MSKARDTAWVLGMNGLQIVCTVLSFMRLANTLGAAGYGTFSFAIAVGGFLPLLAGLGADHVLIMQASRDESSLAALLGNAILLRVVTSVIILASVAATAVVLPRETWVVLVLISTATIVTAFANPLFASYHRVVGRARFAWACLAVGQALFCVLLYVPGVRPTVLSASWAYLATSVAVAVLLAIDVARRITPRFDAAVMRANLRMGAYFSASQLVDMAFQRVDVILLQAIAGAAAVGMYSAGYKFVGLILTIPAALHIIYLPEFHRIAGAASSDDNALVVVFTRTRRFLIEISAAILGAVVVNSHRLVAVFLNASYAPAAAVVTVLGFATLVGFITYPYSMLAEAIGKVGLRLWYRSIATVITAAATAALILTDGITGAAIGVTIGSIMFLGLMHRCTREANGGLMALVRDCAPLIPALLAGAFVVGTQHVYGAGLIGITLSSATFLLLFVVLGSAFNALEPLHVRDLYRTVLQWA